MRGTLTGQRYVDDILRPHVGPFLNGLPGAIFQQDNARPHTARVAQDFLRKPATGPKDLVTQVFRKSSQAQLSNFSWRAVECNIQHETANPHAVHDRVVLWDMEQNKGYYLPIHGLI
ncbi:DDE_3 domain-containing protein [Trichonephila clavipes]|nr:DDE_3 domain-containing protein [Trichonephila clavipes]